MRSGLQSPQSPSNTMPSFVSMKICMDDYTILLLLSLMSPSPSTVISRLNDYTEDQKMDLVASCPTQVFRYDEDASTVTINDPSKCIFCRECTYLMEDWRRNPEDSLAVEVQHSSSRFFFTVESTGSLDAKDIVRDGLKELIEKLGRLQTATMQLDERMVR